MGSRYVAISRKEFATRMDQAGFTLTQLPGCRELVFERQVVRQPRVGCGCTSPSVPGAELPKPYPYKVRIYSTIDERTDESRECDSDAIRVVLVDIATGKPLAGERKVLRTKSALVNTLERARDLWRYAIDYRNQCPKCGSLMLEREGKFGLFLGCSKYPDCKATKQVQAVHA